MVSSFLYMAYVSVVSVTISILTMRVPAMTITCLYGAHLKPILS